MSTNLRGARWRRPAPKPRFVSDEPVCDDVECIGYGRKHWQPHHHQNGDHVWTTTFALRERSDGGAG